MGKLFRVFFSSTFSDFVDERNALHKHVFPKLKEFCAANEAKFQPVDLRWGIPDEVALEQSTMQTCLDEIHRCQQVTERPNYIVILGERYGWTPVPAKIPKTEFELLALKISKQDAKLINFWYREDKNELWNLEDGCTTTVYKLQPREEKYKEYHIWEPIESNLRTILLQAAKKIKLPESKLAKYYASATHQEILNGALNVEDANSHVHCFIRKITKLPADANNSVYFELDKAKKAYLDSLKTQLKKHTPSNIHEYKVNFANDNEKSIYLEKFCNDIYRILQSIITQEIAQTKKLPELEEEIQFHTSFARDRAKLFTGRDDILHELMTYAQGKSTQPFVLYGKPGSGKSAVLAEVYKRISDALPILPNTKVITRFIGTSVNSSKTIPLIKTISKQLYLELGGEEEDWEKEDWNEENSYDYYLLSEFLHKLWRITNPTTNILLIIDALDQLPKTDIGRDLRWIPNQLPEHVKIITSVATDDKELMNTIYTNYSNLHELRDLVKDEAGSILDYLLKKSLRQCTSEQKSFILDNFGEMGTPLYLKLVFEESKYWSSYDTVASLTLATDVDGMIDSLLIRLYKNHTQEVVERIFCYLVATRNGITEEEVLRLLSAKIDSEFFQWYESMVHFELPERDLPWIIWSRLYYDIKPYLTERGVDKTSTFSFFHRQFSEFIEKTLLAKMGSSKYDRLVAYFTSVEYFFEAKNRITPNYRKLSELVYSLRKASKKDELINTLTNLDYVNAKCYALMIDDLALEYADLIAELDSIDVSNIIKTKIQDFQYFILSQAHNLKKFAPVFRYFTVQLAINQSKDSNVSIAAEGYLATKNIDSPCFEWYNKPNQGSDPCILTLSGHTGEITTCRISPDGSLILTASSDHSLKLWDFHTGTEIRTLFGHTDEIITCAFSRDGRQILSLSKDNTLKLWNVSNGIEMRSYPHEKEVYAYVYTADHAHIYSIGFPSRKLDGQGSSLSALKDELLNELDQLKKTLAGNHVTRIQIKDVVTNEIVNSIPQYPDILINSIVTPDLTKIRFVGTPSSSEFMSATYSLITGERIAPKNIDMSFFNSDFQAMTSGGYVSNDIQELNFFRGGYCWACSPTEKKLITGSNEGMLSLYDLNTEEKIFEIKVHNGIVKSCAFSPDGSYVVTASDDRTLKLWKLDLIAESQDKTKHTAMINTLIFSPDGSHFASGSADGNMILWDITREGIKSFSASSPGITDEIKGCLFSLDGKELTSISDHGQTFCWNIETKNEIQSSIFKSVSLNVNTVAVSRNRDRVLIATKEGKFYQFHGWEKIEYVGHEGNINSCGFSAEEDKIFSTSTDKTLRSWDLEGNLIQKFVGHEDSVENFGFSPDGKYLISASLDKTLKLWDTETGDVIRTFLGHSNGVKACNFTPDGKYIISTSLDKTIRLWDVNSTVNLTLFPLSYEGNTLATNSEGIIVCGDSGGLIYVLKIT